MDGGNNWEPGLIGIPTNCSVSELFAVNYDTAWVATYGNTTGGNAIFKTTDGGLTWNAQTAADFSGTAAFANTIYFWDADNGICMGDPNGGYFEIYTTTDGGTTWIRVPQANIPAPASGEYSYNGGKDYDVVGNTIWFGTNKGNVFRSLDRGLNWTKVASGKPEVTNVTFGDADHGIIQYKTYNTQTGAIINFDLLSTTDGGLTWTEINYTGDIFKSDIDAVPGHPGMYITTGSSQSLTECGSAFSLDYGQSWTKIDDSVQYTCVSFFNDMTGWAGGFNNDSVTEGIWKWMGLIQDSSTIIVDFMADSTTIPVGGTVNFTDLSLGYVTSRTWDFVGGTPATSTAQHPTDVLYSAVGTYAVTLSCSNPDTLVAKTKTMYIHVVDPAAVSENQSLGRITVYPNPAHDFLLLTNLPVHASSVEIFDVAGEVVCVFAANEWISLQDLPAGFYLIAIMDDQHARIQTGKFIKY
jgi:PKD repeat protein